MTLRRGFALELAGTFRAELARTDIETLASAPFTGRRTGSEGHGKAVKWLATRMSDLGLPVVLETFEIDRVIDVYQPPRLEILDSDGGPARRLALRSEMAEHPRSADTPEFRSGVARRLDAGSHDGAWVILETVPQGPDLDSLTTHLAGHGAIGILAPQHAGQDGFLAKRLMGGASVGLPVLAVRSDLLPTLNGQLVRARVPVRTRRMTGTNVIGKLRARDDAGGEPILLTAHFDGVGDDSADTRLPAAADNASGIAVLLEVARIVGASGGLSVPLWIGAVDAEELNALGSADHARSLQAAGDRPSVLNLDMAGQFHGSVSVEAGAAAGDVVAALDRAGRHLGTPLQLGPVASDNRRYAGAGFAAVGIGLGAAAYHSPADRPESVDDEALVVAGRLILATLAELEPKTGDPGQGRQ